jgi:phosphatidylglycerol:prolipoprotein diacylglycerol transferase
MGQWLCIPMILGGTAMWLWSRARARSAKPVPTEDGTPVEADEPGVPSAVEE